MFNDMEEELWKEIPGYEGRYAVSNMGRVKRLYKPTAGHTELVPIAPNKRNGYVYVMLYKEGKAKNIRVHRLVMLAFIGPSDLTVNHKDFNKANNQLSNLEYLTSLENTRHFRNRVKHHRSNFKLTPEEVVVIKSRLLNGDKHSEIAKEFGVSRNTITDIACGKTWGSPNEGYVKRGCGKLTLDQATEIKRRAINGELQKNIAKDFNVHRSQVSMIKHGVHWKNVVI